LERLSRRNIAGGLEGVLGEEGVCWLPMDWVRTVLTECRNQRAFVDFFEDQLVSKRYDWKLLLDEFLFEGKEPLINGLVAGREW
jgi:hypothetical protein